MKKFLYQAAGILILLILINSISPALGLIRLYKNYRTLLQPAVKIFKSKESKQADILVIGCSNLQHNIDSRKVQSTVHNADFLYFSGSQNSTFIRYLVDNGFTKDYKTIVIYAPYQMLEKNNFLNQNQLHYEGFGCFQYAKNIIKHNPSAFFFNWNRYCDSIDLYRTTKENIDHPTYADRYIIETDHFVDSLNLPNTEYSGCKSTLNHAMHYVHIPHYSEEDIEFENSLKLKGQNMFVIYPPIPNIAENVAGMAKSKSYVDKIPNTLNTPSLMDSTYFFDQWYHMNKCGKEIETEKMISTLQKLNAKLGYQRSNQ